MNLATEACFVRGHRLARVKFVALPMDATPGNAPRETPRLGERRGRLVPGGLAILQFVSRVIGRLVAARP